MDTLKICDRTIGRLILTGGIRRDSFRDDADGTVFEDKETTYRACAVYRITDDISAFGQYATSFEPQSASSQNPLAGGPFAPTEGDIYETVDNYSRQQRLGYVHLRNVRGKVPHYRESFIDDGDVDVLRVLAILHRNQFRGVIIPDHTPQMSCAAPWHAGMAYALGYLQAGLQSLKAP